MENSHKSTQSNSLEPKTGSNNGLDFERFRTDLAYQLSAVTSPGSFAYWANNLPSINPGLDVSSIGPIALPIHESEARRIIQHAKKAPYGKGSETIVDESVRKTWEIDGRDITIGNPKWTQWLDGMLEQVKVGLGLKTESIRAELYKMLLYGPGAHFKPHRDTEKTPGMFGTLVVCLPSLHEGGDIRVIHDGDEKVLSTSKNSAYEMSCAAWYSDVLHEVRPVITGYRVVLTYNLALNDTSFQPSAADAGDDTKILNRLLSRYATAVVADKDLPCELIFPFKHKYTESSLSVERLKRSDRGLLRRLQAASDGTCEIHLSLMEREVQGDCGEPGWYDSYGFYGWDSDNGEDDESEDSHSTTKLHSAKQSAGPDHEMLVVISEDIFLKHITTLDGGLVAEELPASEDSLIKDVYHSRRCPDEEDFEGFTGNEGAGVTYWYYDAVIVLVPKKLAHSFKLGPRLERQSLLPATVDSLIERLDNEDSHARDDLVSLCEVCVKKEEAHREKQDPSCYLLATDKRLLKSPEQGKLAYACAATQSPALFCRVVALFDSSTLTEYFEPMGRRFCVSDTDRTACLQSLKVAVTKFCRPSERFAALDGFKTGYYATHSEGDTSVLDFVTSTMDVVVDAFEDRQKSDASRDLLSNKDGVALVAVLSKYNRRDLESRILTQLQQITSITGAAIGMLQVFLEYHLGPQNIGQENLNDIYLPLYNGCIQHFDLRKSVKSIHGASQWFEFSLKNQRRDDVLEDQIKSLAQQAAELYGQCLRADDFSETLLLDAIAADIELEWQTRDFESFMVPFLLRLLDILKENSLRHDSHDGRYQKFFQRAVHAYLQNHVRPRPSLPRDWSRKVVDCDCADCRKLNTFLKKGTQKTGRFSMAKKRRDHLSRKLWTAGGSFDEETERGKSPHTLVITKNKKAHERDLKEWHKRVAKAEAYLRNIKIKDLQHFLGPQYFKGQKLLIEESPPLQSSSTKRIPLANLEKNARVDKRALDTGHADLPSAKRSHLDVVDLTFD